MSVRSRVDLKLPFPSRKKPRVHWFDGQKGKIRKSVVYSLDCRTGRDCGAGWWWGTGKGLRKLNPPKHLHSVFIYGRCRLWCWEILRVERKEQILYIHYWRTLQTQELCPLLQRKIAEDVEPSWGQWDAHLAHLQGMPKTSMIKISNVYLIY